MDNVWSFLGHIYEYNYAIYGRLTKGGFEMKRNHIWLIEMFDKGKWWPTVGAYLTHADARRFKKEDWEFNSPYYEYRIRKYMVVLGN